MKRFPLFMALVLWFLSALACDTLAPPDPPASNPVPPDSPASNPAPSNPTLPDPILPAPTLPDPAEAPEQAAVPVLVWVRQDTPIINVDNAPLSWDYGDDPRRQESFTAWYVSESNITSEQRYQEDDYMWYDVSISCDFARPPLVLRPGMRYRLDATFSYTGVTVSGYEGLGERFWYTISTGYGSFLEPPENVGDVLAYFPWAADFNGNAGAYWMVEAPPATQLGDTFQLYASFWNCPPCNVTWTYTVEAD